MVGYLSDFDEVDDDFEYNGHPYRFEYTDEELLERRMQKQREELSCAAALRVDDIIPLDACVESPDKPPIAPKNNNTAALN